MLCILQYVLKILFVVIPSNEPLYSLCKRRLMCDVYDNKNRKTGMLQLKLKNKYLKDWNK